MNRRSLTLIAPALLALALLLAAGCDSDGDESGTQVTYEVTGSNVSSIAYGTGEQGTDAVASVDDPALPWSFTVDALDPDVPVFTVNATTSQDGGTARVVVLVDGDERDSDSASGSIAVASATVTLQ